MAAPTVIIYALPGSQFVFKVLAALEARKIPHYVQMVPVDEKKRRAMIPSGGQKVPEMKVVKEGEAPIIVSDSENILHWLDENLDAKLYPSPPASEISVRASNKTLAGMVWYYNWVNDEGYARSMRSSINKTVLPSWIFLFRKQIIDYALASSRKKMVPMVTEAVGVDESALKDEPRMRALLLDELKYFQSFLTAASTEQPFLLPGDLPTAADFSVYAQLERLVGAGTASDVTIDPSLQEIKDQGSGLERLWEWHDGMRAKFPVHFKGKRAPAHLV